MAAQDRLEALLAQNGVTGIDFVYVDSSQTTLDIYFLNSPATVPISMINDVPASAIRIYSPSGGETLPVVPVTAAPVWVVINTRNVMRVQTTTPGDFSRYRFHIEDSRVDPYFNDVWFSFKANCSSLLDCAPPADECPPDAVVDFPVDYTARDFWSIRQALLDFASQRYPAWKDRLEADVGEMLAEVMSALGDEFAYIQDRYAREAYLETATQRRSLHRLANLVDYQLQDGVAASTWLDFQMNAPDNIPAGTKVSEKGGTITFEVGRGMTESFPPEAPKLYAVDPVRNSFDPHIWDINAQCLPVGSTDIFIEGHHTADIPLDDTPPGKDPGKWMVLITSPTDPAVEARAWMVRVTVVQDTVDLVFGDNITHLQWELAEATPFELDMTVLKVHANLLPATAGSTVGPVRFTAGPDPALLDNFPTTVERIGPDNALTHLFSLTGSDVNPLAWLGATPDVAEPEVRLRETHKVAGVWVPVANGEWTWQLSLIAPVSAQPTDTVFTLDDGYWKRVVGYQRIGTKLVHQDYASGLGKTIRFGDGVFGEIPADGTIFEAYFRLGNGAVSNVPAGSLTQCALATVKSVSNALAATGGSDPETASQVQQLAPEQFRYLTYRAVLPADYADAAERLSWVQRAGAVFRWTGSWMTAFVTPDPKGAFSMTLAQLTELENQIDRFRQAGRPAFVLNPTYATLDLQITICVQPTSYRGDVEAAVLIALFGSKGFRPKIGFFSPDNFTFGTALERSELEAAIQNVPGVHAVEEILIRRRGYFDWRPFSELTFGVAEDEVIRVQNDPFLPERGSVTLYLEGGA